MSLHTSSFQNLTRPLRAIGKSQGYDLVISREFDLQSSVNSSHSTKTKQVKYFLVGAYIVEDDQGSVDASNGVVADARFNGGHAGINEFGGHDGKGDPPQKRSGEVENKKEKDKKDERGEEGARQRSRQLRRVQPLEVG